ncbi:Conotoxin LiCr95 [Parachaetomium inaequale]|uniref:Conotoxin LiCr95 n=1 Tax=Parachaetomium inaequale TaxID=2588326 RepID=A0AAN6PMA1_9PEZI|nr:Conotoxin LiCr95 [Parachaetomium inaequale]
MQFSATALFLLGNAVLGLAMPTPADNAAEGVIEKRCIATGGDCTNRYTECCSSMCSIAHDGTGVCF